MATTKARQCRAFFLRQTACVLLVCVCVHCATRAHFSRFSAFALRLTYLFANVPRLVLAFRALCALLRVWSTFYKEIALRYAYSSSLTLAICSLAIHLFVR